MSKFSKSSIINWKFSRNRRFQSDLRLKSNRCCKCFAASCKARLPFIWWKISSATPLLETCSWTHNWKSSTSGIQAHDLLIIRHTVYCCAETAAKLANCKNFLWTFIRIDTIHSRDKKPRLDLKPRFFQAPKELNLDGCQRHKDRDIETNSHVRWWHGNLRSLSILLIISELIWQTHDLLLLLNKRILRIVCQTTVFLYC